MQWKLLEGFRQERRRLWMLCRTFTGSLLPTSPAQPTSSQFPAQLEALHAPPAFVLSVP